MSQYLGTEVYIYLIYSQKFLVPTSELMFITHLFGFPVLRMRNHMRREHIYSSKINNRLTMTDQKKAMKAATRLKKVIA